MYVCMYAGAASECVEGGKEDERMCVCGGGREREREGGREGGRGHKVDAVPALEETCGLIASYSIQNERKSCLCSRSAHCPRLWPGISPS